MKLYHKILNKFLYRPFFTIFQRLGFHITRCHFYSPIPDTSELKYDLWSKHSQLAGINISEEKQLELLRLFSKFKEEYESFPRNKESALKPLSILHK